MNLWGFLKSGTSVMSAWSHYLHGKRSDVNICCPFSLCYLCTHHNSSRLAWGHRNILVFSWAIFSHWPNCVKCVKIHVRMEGRTFCLTDWDGPVDKICISSTDFVQQPKLWASTFHTFSLSHFPHPQFPECLENLGTHSEIFAISFVE